MAAGGLRQLGFTFADWEGFFGSTTFAAVQELQRQSNLPVTGTDVASPADRDIRLFRSI